MDRKKFKYYKSQLKFSEHLIYLLYRLFHKLLSNRLTSSLLDIKIAFSAKSPVYIFNHIPKTGGEAMSDHFVRWYFFVYSHEFFMKKPFFLPCNKKNQLSEFKSCQIVHGHFVGQPNFDKTTYYLHKDKFPELYHSKHYRLITYVRDPLIRVIDDYRVAKRIGTKNLANRVSLSKFINHDKFLNYYAKIYGVNKYNYKSVMDDYFFIGITEFFQLSLDLLSLLMNKKSQKAFFLNHFIFSPPSDNDETVESLTKEEIESFETANKFDYSIYLYSLERFKKLVETHRNRINVSQEVQDSLNQRITTVRNKI